MSEWENKGMCDDMYYIKVHVPCGTEIMVLTGCVPSARSASRKNGPKEKHRT